MKISWNLNGLILLIKGPNFGPFKSKNGNIFGPAIFDLWLQSKQIYKKNCKILICKDCILIAGPGAHQSIILRELPQMYLRQYGYALHPENFDESNLWVV